MLKLSFYTFFAIFSFAFASSALACGCTSYPFEGTYGQGPQTLTLSYGVTTSDSECPTSINLKGSRPDEGPFNVSLSCQGNTWTGIENAPKLGELTWMVSGNGNSYSGPKEFSEAFAAAVTVSQQINVTVVPTAIMSMIGKQPKQNTLSASMGASAPDCYCNELKSEIAWSNTMIAAYGDPVLMRYALSNNLRSQVNSDEYYVDESNTIQRFAAETKSSYTFEELVQAKAGGNLTWNSMGEPVIAASLPSGITTSSGDDAYGTTDDKYCKIDLMKSSDVERECKFVPVLEATLEHEESHQALCNKYNNLPKFTLITGETVYPSGGNPNLSESEYGSGITKLAGGLQRRDETGLTVPIARYLYSAFSAYPPNHAADEIAAYTADIKVIEDLLRQNCN